MDKFSYALGVSIGQSLLGSGVDKITFDDFTSGVKNVINKEDLLISEEEGSKILEEFFTNLNRILEERRMAEANENLEIGKKFLEENKTKDGVKVTESGLQYRVIQDGSIMQWPTIYNRVRVHYEGRLLDGTIFDSSYNRGESVEFNLNQVIPGWQEGLKLMKPGSKFEFVIPPALGYGEVGVPGHILGNSVLIFTVELLEII